MNSQVEWVGWRGWNFFPGFGVMAIVFGLFASSSPAEEGGGRTALFNGKNLFLTSLASEGEEQP